MQFKKNSLKLTAALILGIIANSAITTSAFAAEQSKLVIIIDNLGDQERPGAKVANLPGQVACSILPHGRFSAKIAELCHAQNKTVILNTPMQAKNNYPLGLGGLHAGMSKDEFIKTLTDDMASVPYIQGLDNHMGSLLTSENQPMSWLMETIKPHGLFFLDNKTSSKSVAEKLARNNQVPIIGRDVFLDDVRTPEAIHKQFTEALRIAKRYGIAVVVAHPYAVTLNYLQGILPNLSAQGYQLASIPQVLNVSIEPVTLTAAKSPTEKSAPTKAPVAPAAPTTKAANNEKPTETKSVKQPVVAKFVPVKMTATQTIAEKTPVTEKSRGSTSSAKQTTQAETIKVPAITGTASQSAIELTVDKEKQRVIVNSVDQATMPNNITESNKEPQSETMSLAVPAEQNSDGKKPTDNEQSNKSNLLSRWSEKIIHFFHKKHTDKTKPTDTQTVAVAEQPITTSTPITVEPKKVAKHEEKSSKLEKKNVVAHKAESVKSIETNKLTVANINKSVAVPAAAAQETAKASHSLVQTFKDNLCKKYSHFCSHPDHPAVAESAENRAFSDLQGKLNWPTNGNIATHFGAELADSKLKYNGVLIQAPTGQPVHAIYQGKVIFANWLQGLGLLLIIDHGNGYMSLYGHNEALYKKVGDIVKPDDLIAAVGNSGTPGPTGLYFEIRHNGQPINPENWCG